MRQVKLIITFLCFLSAFVFLAIVSGQTQNHDFGLTATSFIQTATATFPIVTLSNEQKQTIPETQTVLNQTADAAATNFYANRTEYAQAVAEGTDPYPLTATAEGTIYAPFSLTATVLIAQATLGVLPTSLPCTHYAWTQLALFYSETDDETWLDNPYIASNTYFFCLEEDGLLFSHELIISSTHSLGDEDFYIILEDAIRRLADYPPFQPDLSDRIYFLLANNSYQSFASFDYSEAIATYESGLRGTELAEALGVHAP
jgi:hypothetical protein